MTESIKPNPNRPEANKTTHHDDSFVFQEMMRRAFPNGIDTGEDRKPSHNTMSQKQDTAEAFGTDVGIARAHIEELRQLVSETQKKQADLQEELNRQINERLTSALTGMPNREAFIGWVDQEIDSNPSSKLTVGFLDMDGLKYINDNFGHELADDVIRRIGLILSSGVRKDEDMIAAHRSGDEFLMGVNGANTKRIKEYADSVLTAINRLYIKKGASGNSEIIEIDTENTDEDLSDLHQITASMGFAHWNESIGTPQLMANADKAMYEAKEAGRNRIVIRE